MHQLPELKYSYDSLEPYFDSETMRLHHSKHHQTYIDKLNLALDSEPEYKTLVVEELLTKFDTLPDSLKTAVKNHGGGHANHSLWWENLSPDGGDKSFSVDSPLALALNNSFGSLEDFKQKFNEQALSVFGSGWCWLVVDGDTLSIRTTPNQESPLMFGQKPLLGVDVWEHAYYLKYQNRRAEFLTAFWSVVNWSNVASRFEN